jgi:hypothetical protein
MRYVVIGFCVLAAACTGASPTAPSSAATNSSASQIERGIVNTETAKGIGTHEVLETVVSCTVDVGGAVASLPLVQLIQTWLNIAINDAASSVNCGQVKSLNAKLNVVAAKLVQHDQNEDAACGAATALVNELQALVEGGRLAIPTMSPPPPGGPTNVLIAAEALQQHWCDAAH